MVFLDNMIGFRKECCASCVFFFFAHPRSLRFEDTASEPLQLKVVGLVVENGDKNHGLCR